jgi:ribosomal protein L29
MTAKEIRDKETSHLNAELLDRYKHLFDLRSRRNRKVGRSESTRKTKLDIARSRRCCGSARSTNKEERAGDSRFQVCGEVVSEVGEVEPKKSASKKTVRKTTPRRRPNHKGITV